MKHAPIKVMALLLALAFFLVPPARARIKLASLPVREKVEIQLDNGSYTLVEEERIVPLLASSPEAGNNQVDFSWSNAYIDKDSIQFRPLAIREGDKFRPIKKVKVDGGETDEVAVISSSYPPGENALFWEVYSHKACAVKVRVSYIISNLSRSFSYRAIADKDETKLTLKNYIKITNYSGEEYGEAIVWAGFGDAYDKVVGQEEEIQILLRKFEETPIKKTYTYDWYVNGPLSDDKPFASKVLMHYVLTNAKDNKLGEYPLPPGKVRIFIEDGRGGEAFLGEDMAKLTPLDSEMKIYLGEARDVVCTRTIESNERHKVKGNLHDQEIIVKYEIENFKDKPARLGILERLNDVAREYSGSAPGDVEWEKGKKTSREIDFDMKEGGSTPTLFVDLPARPKGKDKVEKTVVKFHFTLKNLWN